MARRRPRAQHDPAYEALREELLRMRENAGLTQRELALRLRRVQTFVHKCESGDRRIDPVEFCRWAHACGVHPADAIARVDPGPAKAR